MSLFIYLEKEGTRRKRSGKSHVFWKLSRVVPSANLVWPVKVGLTRGRIRKGSCISRGNVRARCDLSPSHCRVCSLSGPDQLFSGQGREKPEPRWWHWDETYVQGREHLCQVEGREIPDENSVAQRTRQGPKSHPECREFTEMGKKMNKMYEKDTGGQASNKFLI